MANIPVPQARYELLKDTTRKPVFTRKILCCVSTVVLITIASLGVIFLFINLHYFENGFRLPNNYHSAGFPLQWIQRANRYSLIKDDMLNIKPKATRNKHDYIFKDPNNYKLVCYYTFPSNTEDLIVERIDPFLCTHIIIGFATVLNNSIELSELQNETLKTVVDMKHLNKKLKVLISVGGSGNDVGFPQMVLNHSNRKKFIRSVDNVIKECNLDGVDLDWEFPNEHQHGDKKQKMHFTLLLRELREEINRHKEQNKFLLTVAVASPVSMIDNSYDVTYINDNVDFINLMTYDFHFYTRFTPFTGLNAPLNPRSVETGYLSTLNINYTAHYWHNKGMDKSKIIIGLPTYAHSFQLTNPANNGIMAPASGYGKLGSLGFVDFSDVCWFITTYNIIPQFDIETKSPYAYKNNEWISYDDIHSLRYKTEFIKMNQFGGAMILSLNADDHNGVCRFHKYDELSTFPLTRTVKNVLFDDQL